MTPEELAEFPLPVLEAALEIKEMQEKQNNKLDLSKIPDDVLDMAIEKGKELEEK